MAFNFHKTRHAVARAVERGLSFEDLEAVVNAPDRRRHAGKGAHGGVLYRYSKSVDGRTLVAVAEVKKSECWIVTGYYEA